jgi:inner membrane protein
LSPRRVCCFFRSVAPVGLHAAAKLRRVRPTSRGSAIPSVFTHAVAAAAIGTAFRSPAPPWRFWVLGAACGVLPDLDGIGWFLGVPYDSALGHRGFLHSFAFATIVASALFTLVRGENERYGSARAWLFVFLATASHGVLDAFTDGGGGVAFFAPFDNSRYAMPWHPIWVSPVRVSSFFRARSIPILITEFAWVWLPSALFALTAVLLRRRLIRLARPNEEL